VTDYEFVLSFLTVPDVADEEEACRLAKVDLTRFANEVDRNPGFRQKWQMALELRALIDEIRMTE
jgi:hypothetical protein